MKKYSLLEFDKLKNIIKEYCYSEIAKEKIEKLEPLKDKNEIIYRLSIIDELKKIDRGFNFSGFSNIYPLLRSNSLDTVFGYEDLKKIYNNNEIVSLLILQKQNLSDLGNLKKIINKLTDLSNLNIRFKEIFDSKGNVKDTASKKLKQIRKSQKSVRKNLLSALEKELEIYSQDNYLTDKIITQRNERYVIPLKKNSVPFVNGMILDSSSSGFSVYFEPAKIIPLNNSLKLLSDEERFEINSILTDFTKEILNYSDELEKNQKILTELDFYQGISVFAKEYNANIPHISDEKTIDLKQARHPLLIKYYGDIKKVVPFDLKLGNQKRIMILSGPNTGGKTVLLKTVGLLTLMALCGLPITAKENSQIGIFRNVFADIGDSQSLDQSLSTFSSHINNVKKMLLEGDEYSLMLIDEIGSSTDPEQGAALAYAILEKIVNLKSTAIITTHYTSLKLFAEGHKECFNASMVFDPKNHIPTYRLHKGIPGNSFALEIAENLGMPKDVINSAKTILGKQNLDLTNILKKLTEERKKLSKEIYKYELKNALYKKKIAEYEEKIKNFEEQVAEKKEKLISKTKEYLLNVQKEIANRLEELKKQQKKNKKELENLFNKVANENKKLQKKIVVEVNKTKIEKPSVGMKVWLEDIQQNGEIVQISPKGIKVDIGGIFYTTNIKNIRLSENDSNDTPKSFFTSINKEPKIEINLLGNTFEEALPKIISFLDDAFLYGLKKVRIIHGKGTGILRRKIRSHLKNDERIKAFGNAPSQAGGDGVTIVEFKDD